jgi:hypothetical protein
MGRRRRRRRRFVAPRPGTTLSHLVKTKKHWCHIKEDPDGFGILIPELLNTDFGTGLGIYKSRGIGIGIPLGTSMHFVCLLLKYKLILKEYSQ